MNRMENFSENMEAQYENQLRVGKEFEKIDVVAKKIVEKYGEYKELKGFVGYLKGMEKIFAEAKINNWKDEKIKEDIVENEIHFLSAGSGLDEDIFKTIRDDFGMVYFTVQQIYDVAEKLLEKYSACEECKMFIEYMKKVSLLFLEAKKEGWSLSIIKDNLCRYRMQKFSADGVPELELLEQVKMEFESAISDIK